MKKLITLLLILLLSTFAFFSCTDPVDPSTPEDPGIGDEGGGDGPNIDPNGWTNS